jgi:uncharacterized RDD family membrane protein YckC
MTDLPRPAPAPAPPLPEPEDFPATGPNALGSFGQRAIARVLDEMIISVPFAIAIYTVLGDGATDSSEANRGAALAILVIAVLAAALYEIGCVGLWGRTLGKLAFGLRVVRYTDGGRPTWPQAALRAMLPLTADAAVAAVAANLWGAALVYASAFFSPLRRGWHDQAGGTLVVRTR